MGLACHGLADVYGSFPTGGDTPWPLIQNYLSPPNTGKPNKPDRQGLGWAFQILPYMEETAKYSIRVQADLDKVVVSAYFCPSRRRATKYPGANNNFLMDYAGACPKAPGHQMNDANSLWQDNTWDVPHNKTWNGVIVRTNWDIREPDTNSPPVEAGSTMSCRFADIRDGTSHVLMIAEKRLKPDYYESGDWHDDRGWTDGWDPDIMRLTSTPLESDFQTTADVGFQFGSSHSGAMMGVFADGSVHSINYEIDADLFNNLGDRRDGASIDEAEFSGG
jgi:hypothetical protein